MFAPQNFLNDDLQVGINSFLQDTLILVTGLINSLRSPNIEIDDNNLQLIQLLI